MNSDTFFELVKDPAKLNADTISDISLMVERYPYFQTAEMLLLRNLLNTGNKQGMRQRLQQTAFKITERKKLFLLLHPDCGEVPIDHSVEHLSIHEVSAHDNNEILTLTTDETTVVIDEPNNKKGAAVQDLKNRYFELEKKVGVPSELIEKFIETEPRIKPIDATIIPEDISTSSVVEKEDIVSEVLAEIYVKQNLIKKAISMYQKLSLKFPEKSTYFASRIEELNNLKN